MKVTTIAFASAIALSAVAPAFAYENDLEYVSSASGTHSTARYAGKRVDAHHAFDARAYVPAPAPVAAPYDFGIGSQS
ncbi:MAG TPA: hypothetical protein VFB29_01495 [Pseudolabrys sp.]|nr:hypothetical protein [Pseudolabrys sp.]